MADRTDELAATLMEAFTCYLDGFCLEQLAVPEDLDDPGGEVELWIRSEECFVEEESRDKHGWDGPILRCYLSISAGVVEGLDAPDLAGVFEQAIAHSEEHQQARNMGRLLGQVDPERIPSSDEQAEMN